MIGFVESADFENIGVSISESRCFSFQVKKLNATSYDRREDVSISESRCFSFQVNNRVARVRCALRPQFQSRNRDAFRFKLDWEGQAPRVRFPVLQVSISESRCFSFQDLIRFSGAGCDLTLYGFNLGIEMLFVSSKYSHRCRGSEALYLFQSRNRDAFRFKCLLNDPAGSDCLRQFQSRNRDAFRFKQSKVRLFM